MDPTDRRDLAQDRRQATQDVRVDSVAVRGTVATVRYSWAAPARPNPTLSFHHPVGGRVHDTAMLRRLDGRWRIG